MDDFLIKVAAEIPGLAVLVFLAYKWIDYQTSLMTTLMNHQSDSFERATERLGERIESLGNSITEGLISLLDKLTNASKDDPSQS